MRLDQLATAQPAPEKRATDDSTTAESSRAAAAAVPLMHMQGRTFRVVSEQLVTSYHSKTGKPFSFVACTVRDVANKRREAA